MGASYLPSISNEVDMVVLPVWIDAKKLSFETDPFEKEKEFSHEIWSHLGECRTQYSAGVIYPRQALRECLGLDAQQGSFEVKALRAENGIPIALSIVHQEKLVYFGIKKWCDEPGFVKQSFVTLVVDALCSKERLVLEGNATKVRDLQVLFGYGTREWVQPEWRLTITARHVSELIKDLFIPEGTKPMQERVDSSMSLSSCDSRDNDTPFSRCGSD